MNTNHYPSGDNSRDVTPEHIAKLLTHATQQLDDSTIAGLRRAHDRALARQAVSRPVFALDAGHGIHWPLPHTARQWMTAAILLALLASGISYWHHAREHEAGHHLDIAILTDDLPMEVFIDR